MKHLNLTASTFALLLAAHPAAFSQSAQEQPQPLPQPPAIPNPQDVAWPGQIKLDVDATDLARHIIQVHETIPVSDAGSASKDDDLVLLYPRFVPGDHSPTGPIADLAGLVIKADGQRVEWLRDVVDVNAFHLKLPQGTKALDVSFQYLSPPTEREGRVDMTPDMIDLAWNTVVLYPAGVFTRGITVQPTLKLPTGWQHATALEATPSAQAADGTLSFKPTPLNTLVDSPLYAGRYFSRIDLDPGGKVPVHLNIVADKPEDLAITPDQLAKHRALVQQAYKTYGSHHYDHYDFLLALSDQLGGVGLEHHRSSENGVDRPYFTDWDKTFADRDLLPHEYTHSWDGKFRRPADLWAPNFSVPERDSLLWVYEGQTEYWGQILAARSGLWSHDEALDALADDAASMDSEAGRSWRPLQDTTNDPIINQRRPQSWRNWERSEDYYVEGLLIWLDADTLIREQTHGQKSLNDFARAFFGINNGSYVTVTYKFEDVVAALNGVLPYDWAGFLRSRLDRHGPGAPLDGITRGGYRLVYNDKESGFLKSLEGRRKASDFSWSIGLSMGENDTISSVAWDSPAFMAGLTKGGKLLAVNGLAYDSADDLEAAIKLAHANASPIELLVQDANHFRTVRIDYHGGLRYPHLERVPNTPALLDDILTPLK